MNIFTVLFWAVWFIYAAFLFQQLMEARRKKKQRKQELCINCKHYKGCPDLHWLIDQGHPLPLCCDSFEREENCNTKPGRRGADLQKLQK